MSVLLSVYIEGLPWKMGRNACGPVRVLYPVTAYMYLLGSDLLKSTCAKPLSILQGSSQLARRCDFRGSSQLARKGNNHGQD